MVTIAERSVIVRLVRQIAGGERFDVGATEGTFPADCSLRLPRRPQGEEPSWRQPLR